MDKQLHPGPIFHTLENCAAMENNTCVLVKEHS